MSRDTAADYGLQRAGQDRRSPVPAWHRRSAGRTRLKAKPTITVAIIAQNEADNLAGLLPQLAWVDEIVLMDGGSDDRTADVARAHDCRVAYRPLDTFAAQRNHAIQLARCEWVLSIDADERPTPRLVRQIRLAVMGQRHSAYRIPIRSSIFGRPVRRSGTQDDRPIRLFRRRCAGWKGDVHERLDVRGRIGQLSAWLEHRTLPDPHSFLVKMHRYTTLEARRRVRAGMAPRPMDRWIRPPLEAFRRLIAKQGFLDGPQGWAFCLLSGLSEWVLADQHARLWQSRPLPVVCQIENDGFVGRVCNPSRSGYKPVLPFKHDLTEY